MSETIQELNAKILKLKADAKAAKEAEQAAKTKEREENEKVRAKVQVEVDKAQKEYDAAKEELKSAKEALDAARAKLPKGTRGSGNGSTYNPFGGKLGFAQPARAVLDVLSSLRGKSGLSRLAIATKAGEMGHKLHHGGRVSNEKPTFDGLTEAGLIVAATVDVDGKSEVTYTLTPKGRDAWNEYKAKAKEAEKSQE